MSTPPIPDVQACVFDAYGTLFDVGSAAERAQGLLGERWRPLAETWRARQLQYTWLRSLARRHADFWQVTGDALDFALASLGIADPALRDELMTLYLSLRAYPDVEPALSRLRAAGLRLAVLSNGSPRMLASAVEHAGIAHLLDAVLSVEEVGVYKPDPRVYQLAVDRLSLPAGRMCFVSSNGWDAFSAKAFGYRALWCNRLGQPPERIPALPDAEASSLAALPGLLGLAG
ncbi:MAG TPA: haloacid dehalogenase type II [Anaeromyxobacteraceae bacterium]